MFDDLKGDNKPIASTAPVSGQSATPAPAKAVVGNPADDIFGDVDPAPKINPTVFGQDKPSAVQLGKIKTVSQTSAPQVRPPASTPPSIVTPRDQLIMEEDNIRGPKKLIIAGAVILLILVVAGIVYFFVKRSASTNQPVLELNQNTNLNVNANQPVNMDNTNEEAVINEVDDDFDGLPTVEEINLGTNPYEPDSDNDGVFDQDEVQIYKTNPLRDDSDQDELSDYQEIFIWRSDPNKPDTDGDGFNDGVEVKNGYNPLGRGLIEDAPAGTFNLEGDVNINQATSTNQNTNQ